MKVVRDKRELRSALQEPRRNGETIGLVPTMGALHEGHLELLRRARADCGLVVMSLFVNPAQFGPGEDLDRYPRDEAGDLRLAEEQGTDLVYAPQAGDVYPPGFSTRVVVGGLTEVLCGDPSSRGPEHFSGVTTVVAKLFNTVEPQIAYFGQKDAQQAAAIKRMVHDLDFPVRIEVVPTVREADGLAMSSRNAYLDAAERRQAAALSRALRIAAERSRSDPLPDALAAAREELAAAGVEPEYLEARDPEDLGVVAGLNGRPVLIAVAARIGDARLIDNVLVEPENE